MKNITNIVWSVARIALGWHLLWAFFDKLLGLGFSTCRAAESGNIDYLCQGAWISGGSPTLGFLKFGTSGPFASFYQAMAGNALVDVLFMAGLFFIGLAMIAGIGLRIAGFSGVFLMLMMWSAVLPKEHDPIFDEHIIYILVFISAGIMRQGGRAVLGKWWRKTAFVKKFPIFR